MTEVNLDDIIKAASNPDVAKNADSLSGLLDDAVRFCEKLDKILEFIDKRGYNEIIKRGIIKKYKLNEVESLEGGIIPKTEMQRAVMEHINAMSDDDIKRLASVYNEQYKKLNPGTDSSNEPDATHN